MSRFESSLPTSYFDDLYAANADPWNFKQSDYEAAKYEATLEALPSGRFGKALEVGCSIGVLTRRLAARCDDLLAIDVAETALNAARHHNRDQPHVAFASYRVPGQWPEGLFDLIVLSEVVYYLDRADVGRLAARLAGCVQPDATIVLVHWLGPTHYPLSGDEAADLLIAELAEAAELVTRTREPQYRLDVLRASSST